MTHLIQKIFLAKDFSKVIKTTAPNVNNSNVQWMVANYRRDLAETNVKTNAFPK